MDRTTDRTPPAEVERFYDSLSGVYDRMTGFERRFVAERPFYRLLVERHAIATALDAGAGTGFHSLLLAELGVRVTAVDLSDAMLRSLRAHALERRLAIETRRVEFQELPAEWDGRFDAVFCVGNSLPHILAEAGMHDALSAFRRVLRPGGVLFVQLLNYGRILRARERIQGVRDEGGTTFIRFYDFEGGRIRFNVLQVTRGEGEVRHQLEGVTLRPWGREELGQQLRRSGFSAIQAFGGMTMEPFSHGTSRDLVLVAAAGPATDLEKEDR